MFSGASNGLSLLIIQQNWLLFSEKSSRVLVY